MLNLIGRIIARKSIEAIAQHIDHKQELVALESCLQANDLSIWEREIEDWERDNQNQNPFEIRVAGKFNYLFSLMRLTPCSRDASYCAA
jgi:hypothetical protein